MNKKSLAFAGVGFAALLIGSVLAVPTAAGASSKQDFTTLHGAQARSATSIDRLPDVLLDGENATELDLSSARYQGVSENAKYWSVLHASGALCLVVQPIKSDDGSVAGTCGDRATFAKNGLMLSVQDTENPSNSFVSYLLPDAARSANPPGLQRVSATILEGSLEARNGKEAVLDLGESEVVLRAPSVSHE